MFLIEGTIRYSPESRGDNDSKYWVVVDCDPSIGKYYRHLYYMGTWEKLRRAAWGDHISCVRNEKPPDDKLPSWRKHEGKLVEIECSGIVKSSDLFAWLPVKCSFLEELRLELGLNAKPEFDFHLTIGNLK